MRLTDVNEASQRCEAKAETKESEAKVSVRIRGSRPGLRMMPK